MGTAHDAEELGLCPHGLACQAGAWGHYIGFCLGYGHIWPKIKSGLAGKNIPLALALALAMATATALAPALAQANFRRQWWRA
jgi:glucose dehydrogenase